MDLIFYIYLLSAVPPCLCCILLAPGCWTTTSLLIVVSAADWHHRFGRISTARRPADPFAVPSARRPADGQTTAVAAQGNGRMASPVTRPPGLCVALE